MEPRERTARRLDALEQQPPEGLARDEASRKLPGAPLAPASAHEETPMIRTVTTAATLACFMSAAAFLSPISVSPALAQSCKNEAMSKDGKPLAGAAKTP